MEVCKRQTSWEDIPVSFHRTFVGPEILDTFSFYPLDWHVRIVIINSGKIFFFLGTPADQEKLGNGTVKTLVCDLLVVPVLNADSVTSTPCHYALLLQKNPHLPRKGGAAGRAGTDTGNTGELS